MAKRRANGEGSIANGAMAAGGRTPLAATRNRKAVYKNVLGKTQAEVKAKLKAAIESSADIDVMKAEQYTHRPMDGCLV